MKSKVALVECRSYEECKEKIKDGLDLLGGIKKFVKPGDKVLIKPNLSDPIPPEKAAVTHPLFIKAMTELVLEITSFVWIGEQSASSSSGTTEKAFEISGVNKALKNTPCRIRNLQEEDFIPREINNHYVLDRTDFSKAVFQADVNINLPKFKSHGMTQITGAIKNPFGFLHPNERQYMHNEFKDRLDFSKCVVDIYSVVKPQLTIMDAILSMEGDEGPSYGKPIWLNRILISDDGVAVDAVISKITGHDPKKVPMIAFAEEKKLGVAELSNIEIVGAKLRPQAFKRHSSYESRNKQILQPSITDKCKKCGECYENCPVDAIEKTAKGFSIIKDRCIQCLCCLEVCVHSAISLEKQGVQEKDANIRLGKQCNQACLFCTVADDPEEMLNEKDAIDKIKYLAKEGVTNISFTGGEPTLRDDLPGLIALSKKLGMSTVLQTNGIKLADLKYAEMLKEKGLDGVLISYHSHKEDIYNLLTKSKMYKLASRGLKNIVTCGLNLHISHVINSKNYRHLVEFTKEMISISPKVFLYYQFIRPNGTTQQNRWLVPKLTEIELELHAALVLAEEQGATFAVEGVPLCYLLGYEKYCSETQRMAREPQIYVGQAESKHDDLHEYIHSKLKRKANICRLCQLNARCAGVWREYAEIHGTDELYPLFHEI